jgi:hypothetical protein
VVCEDGSHGVTVSAAAHDREGTAADHAARVVDAAHSDCGKPRADEDAADEVQTDDTTAVDDGDRPAGGNGRGPARASDEQDQRPAGQPDPDHGSAGGPGVGNSHGGDAANSGSSKGVGSR